VGRPALFGHGARSRSLTGDPAATPLRGGRHDLGLLRQRDLRLLLTSRLISDFGTGVAPIALAFGVLALPDGDASSLGLVLLCAAWVFLGLVGHDPWKTDDAISIGLAYDIVRGGDWLVLKLAGQPYADAPLYYWAAAITTHLFSWLLPAHDAARLSSGVFTLLALEFILLAARELHGRDHAAAAPLLLAGSIGFLFHAHEAQPMLAALTAHAAAYWALTLRLRRPRYAAVVFACALALGFLANGGLPIVTSLNSGTIGRDGQEVLICKYDDLDTAEDHVRRFSAKFLADTLHGRRGTLGHVDAGALAECAGKPGC